MLLRNVRVGIKNKPLRLIGLTLLVIFASVLFVSISYTVKSVEDQLYDYVDEYNQEDFSFDINPKLTSEEINYLKTNKNYEEVSLVTDLTKEDQMLILKDRIEHLESEFNISIEPRQYKQFTYNSSQLNKNLTIRVFKSNDEINKTYIESGRLATNHNEITVNEQFAKSNHLKIGDQLTIKNKDYTIVGFVYFVDYIYPQLSKESFVFDSSKQILAQVSTEEFNSINESLTIYYSGVFDDENKNYEDVETIDSHYIWNLKDSRSQFRTGAIFSEVEGNKAMNYALSGVILFLAVIIIAIIVNKSINAERTQIGVIKALGYNNYEILKAYMIYPLITGIAGSIIGYFIGYLATNPLIDTYKVYYQMPIADVKHSVEIIISSIVFPIILLNLFGLIVIYLIVRKKPLNLIKIQVQNKVNFIVRYLNKFLKNFNFKTRFKYSVATRGIGKLLVTFVGVMIASIYLVFAVSGMKSFDTIIDEAFGSSTYDYQITYNQFVNDEVDEKFDKFMLLPTSIQFSADKEEASLIGIEEELNLFSLEDEDENDLINEIYQDHSNVVVTSMLASLRDINTGDTITIITPNNEQKELKVIGITENYMNPYIYMQLETANNYIGLNQEHYNGLWTDEKLEDERISTVFDRNDMVETMEEMMELAKMLIYVMIIISVILALIVLVMIANFNIEDNFKMISFLKVIGYTKKEISSMVMNVYFPIVLIAYLVSVPLTIASLTTLMSTIGEQLNFVIPFKMNFIQVIIGAVIILVTYYLSLMITKRKLEKVSLQETLKYNE